MDVLSRIHTHGENVTTLDDAIPCLSLEEESEHEFQMETLTFVGNRTRDAQAPPPVNTDVDCSQPLLIEKQEPEIMPITTEEFV